ncbi:hypothetical protein GCM10009624_31370 [Gordonia sinesedis]
MTGSDSDRTDRMPHPTESTDDVPTRRIPASEDARLFIPTPPRGSRLQSGSSPHRAGAASPGSYGAGPNGTGPHDTGPQHTASTWNVGAGAATPPPSPALPAYARPPSGPLPAANNRPAAARRHSSRDLRPQHTHHRIDPAVVVASLVLLALAIGVLVGLLIL